MIKDNKVAVVFLNGQSNAHAHRQYLKEEYITVPLKNVFSQDVLWFVKV